MDMIRHQTIGPDLHFALPAPFGQESEVGPVIIVIEESLHPSVATLGNVVRDSGCYDTGDSGHVLRLIEVS